MKISNRGRKNLPSFFPCVTKSKEGRRDTFVFWPRSGSVTTKLQLRTWKMDLLQVSLLINTVNKRETRRRRKGKGKGAPSPFPSLLLLPSRFFTDQERDFEQVHVESRVEVVSLKLFHFWLWEINVSMIWSVELRKRAGCNCIIKRKWEMSKKRRKFSLALIIWNLATMIAAGATRNILYKPWHRICVAYILMIRPRAHSNRARLL